MLPSAIQLARQMLWCERLYRLSVASADQESIAPTCYSTCWSYFHFTRNECANYIYSWSAALAESI